MNREEIIQDLRQFQRTTEDDLLEILTKANTAALEQGLKALQEIGESEDFLNGFRFGVEVCTEGASALLSRAREASE